MLFFIWSVMLKMQKASGTRAGLGKRAGTCCQFQRNHFTAQSYTSLLPSISFFMSFAWHCCELAAVSWHVGSWNPGGSRATLHPSVFLKNEEVWDSKILASWGIQGSGIPSVNFDFCAINSAFQSSALSRYGRSQVHIPTPGISTENVARNQRAQLRKDLK